MSELSAFEIPTAGSPQIFSITLIGVQYQIRLTFNAAAACWQLDLYDLNGNLLLGSAPLVTGTDLLAQYRYLGIGGSLIVQTDNDPDAVPTFQSLGTTGHLYFIAPAS